MIVGIHSFPPFAHLCVTVQKSSTPALINHNDRALPSWHAGRRPDGHWQLLPARVRGPTDCSLARFVPGGSGRTVEPAGTGVGSHA